MRFESRLRFGAFVITISVFILLSLSRAVLPQVDLLPQYNSNARTEADLGEKTASPSNANRQPFDPGTPEKPGDSQH